MKIGLGCILGLSLTACHDPAVAPPSSSEIRVPSASEIGAGQEANYKNLLAQIERRNPVQEAQAAIQRGDFYFYCNAGRSNTVPGLTPDNYAKVNTRCETRCLEGVTDALYGSYHAQYVAAAMQFSARWNQTMFAACR